MPERIPLYLDCDTGVDDALALAYLLASPAVDIVGIGTVSGNTSAAQGARNTLDLLALAGAAGIPVAVGAHDHLDHPYGGGAPHVHGENGIGDVELPLAETEPDPRTAAQLLIDLSHRYAGRLHVLAIGPLTNIALALEADPTLPERVDAVTVMGGSALAPGNITAVAEANVYNDPQAAAALVEADWDVTLVPLDATMEHTLSEAQRTQLLLAESPFVQAIGAILDHYFDFYTPTYGERTSALHDPLAAVLAVGAVAPTRAPRVPVVVDTSDGPGRGQTIADLRGQRLGPRDHDGARVRVVLDVDAPVADHIVEVVLAG
ncbi:nucleoside hydrolase [Microbacterium sp. SORGH_AS_0888]|uniref:nucleoside hydrolase n=1 Tax=Microbacterium sp. SORGH_AS_0888 TaxID=3041791 RepID=UPI0027815104|nr:nucleoside hydrolase [Microbacterium sp. SORGH_AS_0888]MDQ1129814.1 purine nucleosidase [Microbacterium sp. SORGH_AS_0888]